MTDRHGLLMIHTGEGKGKTSAALGLAEANVAANDQVLVTLGSSKVPGLHGPGTGFLIRGRAAFITSGPDFDALKARFAWSRATLAITVASAEQTV